MRAFLFSLALQAPARKETAAKAADPAAKAIAAIEKSGGSVRALAQNDERKEVSFYLQGTAIKDADVAPVAQVPKVAYLHLGKTGITDAGMVHLRGLTELEQLHLEGTGIGDGGLANLKDLKKLTYLNLYNTGVSDAGLAHLAGLAALKSLYLWQTKVTDAGVAKLKQALPNVQIVRGWDLEPKPAPAAAAPPGKK